VPAENPEAVVPKVITLRGGWQFPYHGMVRGTSSGYVGFTIGDDGRWKSFDAVHWHGGVDVFLGVEGGREWEVAPGSRGELSSCRSASAGQVSAHLAAGEPVISGGQAADQPRSRRQPDRWHTTTRTGLTIRPEHDTGSYPRGIEITDRQMRELETQITRHDWHGEWNYCVNPAKAA
jgi:Rhodopirellula transposase DDE domain